MVQDMCIIWDCDPGCFEVADRAYDLARSEVSFRVVVFANNKNARVVTPNE